MPKPFDPNRIRWDDLRRIGRDPSERGFVVREFMHGYVGQVNPERVEALFAEMQAQLERLQQPGEVLVPQSFRRTLPVVQDGYGDVPVLTSYIYTERIAGKEPDPANLRHAPHIVRIGNNALDYLSGTPVGGIFACEATTLDQHLIGWPWNRTQTRMPYMVDVGPILTVREEPGGLRVDPELPSFAECVGQVRDYADAIRPLPRPMREETLAVEALRERAAAFHHEILNP